MTNPDPIKTCQSCTHAYAPISTYGRSWGYARCTHPAAELPDDLVTGEARTQYCNLMRMENRPCGPDALLWEQKSEEPSRACEHVAVALMVAGTLGLFVLAAAQGG